MSSSYEEMLVLSAHEGDRIFLPCLIGVNEQAVAWKINNILYSITQLPAALHLQILSNGILVLYATINAGGNFTCYIYKENYSLQPVSTVFLMVRERNTADAGNII